MIRFFAILTAIIILYFSYGIYLAQVDLEIIPREIGRTQSSDYYDYRGAINVQSDLSTGLSSANEIVDDARAAGLDFLVMTDVNQFGRADFLNGYYGGLMVMSEGEYSFLDSRVLLLASNSGKSFPDAAQASLFLTDLLSQPGENPRDDLTILAHPFQNGQPTWSGSYPSGLHGIEILNPKSMSSSAWRDSKLDIFWSLVTYPFNSRYAFLRLFREPSSELATWDSLLREQTVYGFAGADANARALPLANYLIRFPTYQKSLELNSNHILLKSELTGNFAKDRAKIMNAFRQGNFYISMDALADPKGFNALLYDHDKPFLMGSKVPFRKGQVIEAVLPQQPNAFFEIVLWKNGQREMTENSTRLRYEVEEPGVYRIQVRVSPMLPIPDGKRWISWIYSNPFIITKR